MTLQERLRASAKELVRLLEEDERERERKAERVDRLANQPIKRFFKKLEEEGMIIPVEVNLDNGKAFDECYCPICRSILCGQGPEMIAITVENGKELRCMLIKPKVVILEGQCKRSLREPFQDQSAASESSFSVSEGTGDQPEACPGTPDRSPLLAPEFRALVNQQMRLTRRIYDEVQGLIKRSQPKLRQPQMPKETDEKRRTSARHQ